MGEVVQARKLQKAGDTTRGTKANNGLPGIKKKLYTLPWRTKDVFP